MKICSKCKENKSLDNFCNNKKSRDGYGFYCKACRKKLNKLNYEKNKEKWKGYCDTYRKNNPEKTKENQKKASKNYYSKNKKKVSEYYKEYYTKNKEDLLDKRNSIRNLNVIYDSEYAKSISWHDYTECSEDGFLIVKCKYCGKKFIPKNKAVCHRAYSLNTNGIDTCGLYCSSGCKKACPIYRKQTKYKGKEKAGSSREVQPELRQMCLARDGYSCQKCGAKGKTVQLHCHHIYPLNESPITSADVDDCITLCKSCHKEAHKIAGCNTFELRCTST